MHAVKKSCKKICYTQVNASALHENMLICCLCIYIQWYQVATSWFSTGIIDNFNTTKITTFKDHKHKITKLSTTVFSLFKFQKLWLLCCYNARKFLQKSLVLHGQTSIFTGYHYLHYKPPLQPFVSKQSSMHDDNFPFHVCF